SSPLSPGNRCRTSFRASTAPPATRTLSPSNSSHDGTLLTIQALTSQTPPERRAGTGPPIYAGTIFLYLSVRRQLDGRPVLPAAVRPLRRKQPDPHGAPMWATPAA